MMLAEGRYYFEKNSVTYLVQSVLPQNVIEHIVNVTESLIQTFPRVSLQCLTHFSPVLHFI